MVGGATFLEDQSIQVGYQTITGAEAELVDLYGLEMPKSLQEIDITMLGITKGLEYTQYQEPTER